MSAQIRPGDCTLFVGIPTTAEDFDKAIRDKPVGRRDFVHVGDSLAVYEADVIRPFQQASRHWRRYGVRVVEGATSEQFVAQMRNRPAGVTILLSHCPGSAVEFFDGLLDTSAFATAVPADFNGMLDLCMCQPMSLVSLIKQRAPRCTVRFVSTALHPAVWFDFYARLFRLLKTQPQSYVDAVERVSLSMTR